MPELTFEEVDKLLSYDPETGVLTWKVTRAINAKAGSVAGGINGAGYARVTVKYKQYLAHRLAWLLHTGQWPSQHIDHIDGDPTNNRAENLRECTQAQNLQNCRKGANNSSGVQGVYWEKRYKKWAAEIRVRGKKIFLGYFGTIEEAACARAEGKAKYHTFGPVDR